MNTYYTPGPQRAERVSDLFAKVAPRYDLINDLQSCGLHRLWKRRLVDLVAPQPGEFALDVCSGTGDIAFGLARHGARVCALDFSEPMLQKAAARKSKVQSPKSKVEFVLGDGQRLPFADSSFDIVAIGYGLRNLASWETGLEEMARVARPAGRLLILDFSRPSNPIWRLIYFAYLAGMVPLIGKVLVKDAQAYSYILESLKHYPAPEVLAERLKQLGFHEVRIIKLLGGTMTIHCANRAT